MVNIINDLNRLVTSSKLQKQMLEPEYINNLIKLRDWLLENRSLVEPHLNFSSYATSNSAVNYSVREVTSKHFAQSLQSPECGTTCCALGWAVYSNLFRKEGGWDRFILQNFGVQLDTAGNEGIGDYLFGMNHPPDFDKMIQRFNYVITNNSAPKFWE